MFTASFLDFFSLLTVGYTIAYYSKTNYEYLLNVNEERTKAVALLILLIRKKKVKFMFGKN